MSIHVTRINCLKWLPVMMIFLLLAGCNKESSTTNDQLTEKRFNNPGQGWGNTSPEMVLRWNAAATYVVVNAVPGPPIPPFIESRYYAMVNLAMHDALNNIVPKYETYATTDPAFKGADPNAAVAQAAHDVIVYFFDKLNPPANVSADPVKAYIGNLLSQSLSAIDASAEKAQGITLGKLAAANMIARRATDGVMNTMFPVFPANTPGTYQFTFPFTVPPFQLPPPFVGFYDAPGWGNLTTFGLTNSTQFGVPAPYALSSAAYAADYNEVKRLGCVNCTGANGRSVEQEDIAKFWVESSPYTWNKIAREIISQKNMDAWRVAHLLALLQMTEADAYIACLKAKMTHFFWRPVTAIQRGNSDGNANTAGDPTWEVLVFPTPPVADHPSAHATAGGAGAELIKNYFGTDEFSFSIVTTTNPGKARQFTSLSGAARENSLSRIYVGYHFRKACMDGEALGNKIGDWVAANALKAK